MVSRRKVPKTQPKGTTAVNFFFPDQLHGKLKAIGSLRGQTLQELVIELLDREVNKELRAAAGKALGSPLQLTPAPRKLRSKPTDAEETPRLPPKGKKP